MDKSKEMNKISTDMLVSQVGEMKKMEGHENNDNNVSLS